MFFDSAMSTIGKSTQGVVESLRRQLGAGVDPAFDYEAMMKEHKARKKEKDGKSIHEDPGNPAGTAGSGMDQLRRVLKDVVGTNVAEQIPVDDEEMVDAAAVGQPVNGDHKVQLKLLHPSWVFKAVSRNEIAALDISNRWRAPPPGSYRPKEELCQPRVKGVVPIGTCEKTRSLKEVQLQEQLERLQKEGQPYEHLIKPCVSVELLDNVVEKAKPKMRVVDISKLTDRPDLIKAAGLHFNVNTFTDHVLDGDLFCSHSTRRPEWDFAKLSVAQAKTPETYFQPGQYNVNIEVQSQRQRIGKKNIPFEKRPSRKPLRETIGRVEIESRIGDHLPDRSMSRSCPCLSKFTHTASPDFKKYSLRPPVAKPVEYYRKDVESSVMKHSLAFNAMEAEKVLWRKTGGYVERFSQSLTREQQLRKTRAYGSDACLTMARENLNHGPVSVEWRSKELDDSPTLRRKVSVWDFGQMAGREIAKKSIEPPSRRKDMGNAGRFEREIRPGEQLTEPGQMSPLASAMANFRTTRTFEGNRPSCETA